MKKKAAIPGQILIYVLAIVIFSMTLLYGYKAIKQFRAKTTDIELLQVEKDIKNEVEKMKFDYRSVSKKILNVPLGYEEVCFVSSFPFPNSISTGHGLIDDHINGGFEDKNMFLWPDGDVSFYIGDIKVNGGFECIEVTGNSIVLRLEGMGDYVKISKFE